MRRPLIILVSISLSILNFFSIGALSAHQIKEVKKMVKSENEAILNNQQR